MIKLNLGSNSKNIGDDWINVDGLELENVDALCDFNIIPFMFLVRNENKLKWLKGNKDFQIIPSNSIDRIQMIEVLEHISFNKTHNTLVELRRILKKDGVLHIQVPDCGKMIEYYEKGLVCDCVNHKDTGHGFHAYNNCPICKGRAIVNTKRFFYSFTGAQKHKYDSHLAIFTFEKLKKELLLAGFKNIEFKEHVYKLKVTCNK